VPERRDLSPADACWLYSEWEKNHQTVSALLWTDRRVDPEALREAVQTRLIDQYPVFVQRVVMSRNPLLMPHWEDDPDFDIGRHIEVLDLAAPGDKATLQALVSEQRTPLLDRDHPLWKIYLIQGYQGDGSAMHLRIQHSIADGWALVQLFLSLTDEADEETSGKTDSQTDLDEADEDDRADDQPDSTAWESPLRLRRRTRRAVTGLRQGLHPASLARGRDALEETLSVAADPSRFVEFGSDISEALAEQVQDAGARIAESTTERVDRWNERGSQVAEAARLARAGVRDGLAFTFPARPGKTILHGDVGGQKLVAWMDPIPLAPVKETGRALDATINDVLMGALTNALRQYLLDRDALTVEELRTSVPITLRNTNEDLPRNLGNKFGLVPVLLPVGLDDPIQHVLEIKRQVDEIKTSMMPIASFGLLGFTALTTPEIERQIHAINQSHSIGVTTNVPGPRHEVSLCGAKVLGAWGMGGLSGNMNLSFGIFSLNGEVNFAVHSDAALTPDPDEIVRLFRESLLTLQTRAGL
jgi:diacylglycerol O-acyltransferase